jgi:succinoglycan biosynthesis transport protein ExoP
VPLDQALAPVANVEGLWSLSTRSAVPNPTELLSSSRARDLFTELAERFDLILIDSPPVLPVADALILTSYADAVLLIVASAQSRRTELQRTMEKLAQANAPVVGMVLNKADTYGAYGRYGASRYSNYSYLPGTPAHGGDGPGMRGGLPSAP